MIARYALALVALAALVAPLVSGQFWTFVYIEVVVFALYAVTFNLLFGFGGMLPFGHAAFFGLGAYGLAVLVKKAAWHPLLALLAAIGGVALAAGGFGALGVVLGALFVVGAVLHAAPTLTPAPSATAEAAA